MDQVQQKPSAERSRVLPSQAFVENANISIQLPLDTVSPGLWVRLSGSVVTTFASGTPVAKAESTMDSLISRIDVSIDGGNTFKSIRPHLLHIQSLLAFGVASERFASAGASAVADNYPVTEQGFVFGTTGQITTVRESVYLPFEMVHCEPGMGREATYLNLKRANSAEIRFNCSSFANLLGTGNTAPVVWSSNLMTIEVTLVERPDIDAKFAFAFWRQMQRTTQINQESRDLAIDLSVGGSEYTGILLFAQDGAAGSTTTATGALASNLLLTNIALRKNGSETLQKWNFKQLNAKNRAVAGVVSSFSGGVSRFDGIGHINFLNRRDLSQALPAYRPDVSSLQLIVDTNNSTNVSYTNPAKLTIVTEELVKPVA